MNSLVKTNLESMESSEINAVIENSLAALYGKKEAKGISEEIINLCKKYASVEKTEPDRSISEKDIFLITYGDSIQKAEHSSLKILYEFLQSYIGSTISYVHLLPFYPYTSDDGFSVKDYRQVNPPLGDWGDISNLKNAYKLVFDAVLNHVSSSSVYMLEQCKGNPDYKDFLLTVDPSVDTSLVTRPRNLPLLNEFDTSEGKKWFWTTFSRDQIDFNFKNPKVLLEMLDILLFYAKSGASMIRLDAVPFMWKEIGTTCSHLPQNHEIVKLIRNVYDLVYPETILLSETNVPHHENIAYFGNGSDEAQIIYNFTLPPLILHSMHTGNAQKFTDWAKGFEKISDTATFLNITATHDGIGMRSTEGILSDAERNDLVNLAIDHGGKVGEKQNPDGTTSPYELNLTYYDAINNPNNPQDEQWEVNKFILSQAIPLSFMGLPGIYIHSLVGTRNDYAAVEQSSVPRSINRKKLLWSEISHELDNKDSHPYKVLAEYKRLIGIRKLQSAFHPNASQQVIDLGPQFFALTRTSGGGESILAVHNVTSEIQTVNLPENYYMAKDLLSEIEIDQGKIILDVYQFVWLKVSKA